MLQNIDIVENIDVVMTINDHKCIFWISLITDMYSFIKHLDLKIMLPHRFQVLKLTNKTPPQSTMLNDSRNVLN